MRSSTASQATLQPALPVTVAPIPAAFLNRRLAHGLDDLGQPVKRVTAQGGEPCRDILRRARPGEKLILASFTPFTKPGPYHEYGPVFVLEEESAEQAVRDRLPAYGTADAYLREQFVVRAYSQDEEIVDAALIAASDFESTIDRFFQDAGIAFLHVRYPTYGCFSCRIDRGQAA